MKPGHNHSRRIIYVDRNKSGEGQPGLKKYLDNIGGATVTLYRVGNQGAHPEISAANFVESRYILSMRNYDLLIIKAEMWTLKNWYQSRVLRCTTKLECSCGGPIFTFFNNNCRANLKPAQNLKHFETLIYFIAYNNKSMHLRLREI